MAEDYRDKIQEIRARRRGDYGIPGQGQGPGGHPGGHGGQGGMGHGGGGYDPTPSIGANRGAVLGGVSSVNVAQQTQPSEDLFGPGGIKSPWLRDRVTLSLEGQIAMMELRSNTKVGMVDLGYTNRIPILPIRSGIFVKIEPPGTYKLCYHYR